MLKGRLELSERRACEIAGQHRSTQRHELTVAPDDEALRRRLRKLSARKPRWGYRRAHGHLVGEGWNVNRKRIQRLWREEGLRVPAKKRKRRRAGSSTAEEADRLRATHPGHVWALDFQHDATTDGRELKFLNVVDELPARPWRPSASARSTPTPPFPSSSASSPSEARPRTSAPTTAPS